MTLTGKAAEDLLARTDEAARQRRAEELATARADASARGKQPFDLEALERLCDTSHGGRLTSREDRYSEFERRYYVHHPDVMTISEFAAVMRDLDRW